MLPPLHELLAHPGLMLAHHLLKRERIRPHWSLLRWGWSQKRDLGGGRRWCHQYLWKLGLRRRRRRVSLQGPRRSVPRVVPLLLLLVPFVALLREFVLPFVPLPLR